MADVRFWVKRYRDEGWSVLPIPAGEKGPRTNDWESREFDLDDFEADSNVGVHLGKPTLQNVAALYDVDLDCAEALVAADILLPSTARVSGRASKPRSHRFYTCDELIETVPYYGLGGANDTLVELRGRAKAGTPQQTMIPPSVHPEGERCEWNVDQKPAHHKTSELLQKAVRNVAIASLVARCFPGPGNRHAPRLALAGFLFRAGLDEPEVLALGKAVMAIIGGDLQDWYDTAKSTIAKVKADAKAVGGPALKELLLQGEAVLKRLNAWLGRTDAAAIDDLVDRLNRHYFIIEAGTKPVVGDDADPDGIRLWTFDDFRKKFIKERLPTRKTLKGKTIEGRCVADVWLEHDRGRQFEQLIYAPPGSNLKIGPRDYNGWKGFSLEPQKGPWSLIGEHLRKVICEDDPDLHAWVLNWCAALIQRPGEHAVTALVLRGGQGVGKGTFAHDLLGKLFDRRHYAHIFDRQQFYGRFNEVLSGRCLLFLDEATWGGDKTDAGKLKGYITSDGLIVERKHLPALTERSLLHIILASNEDWPVGIDRDDRRFCALNVRNERANDPTYFQPLYDELEHGGRAAFLADLLEYPVVEEMLRQPPTSRGKDELKRRSLPAEAEVWLEWLHEGRLEAGKGWPTFVFRRELYDLMIRELERRRVSRLPSPNQFGLALKKFCPSAITLRKARGGPRHYRLPDLNVARQEFEVYLGSSEEWEDGLIPP